MKFILLTLLLLPASASAEMEPWDPCAGAYCPPKMQEIATEYLAATNAPAVAEMPFVASGECYHQSYNYDPNYTHYGITLLDAKNGNVYMGGLFGFFYRENPYSQWDVVEARKNSPRLYQDNHRVSMHKDYAFADMNPGGDLQNRMNYWLRQSGSTLYVIGLWGYTHIALCRFQKQNP
jgi:hypothetical protein